MSYHKNVNEPLSLPKSLEKPIKPMQEVGVEGNENWGRESLVKVFSHDSREANLIGNGVDVMFSSLPYLNNLGYCEFFKVYTYLW